MSEEHKEKNEELEALGSEKKNDNASRARNKTVMLTPEVTGQLRALLHRDEGSGIQRQGIDPLSHLLPPAEAQVEPDSFAPKPREGTGSFGKTTEVTTRTPSGNLRVSGQPVHATSRTPGFSVGGPAPVPQSVTPAVPQAQASFSVRAQRPVAPKAKIIGFLISFDKEQFGEIFEIRAGRWLLSSRPTEHGDNILIDDETISPLHAIVRATSEGKLQVLDQLSEHGTGVVKAGEEAETEVAGSLVDIGHGDVVRFGKRKFTVCVIPGINK